MLEINFILFGLSLFSSKIDISISFIGLLNLLDTDHDVDVDAKFSRKAMELVMTKLSQSFNYCLVS